MVTPGERGGSLRGGPEWAPRNGVQWSQCGGRGVQYHSWHQGIKGQGKAVEGGTVLSGTKVLKGRVKQWRGVQYHSWYQGIKGQGKTVEGGVQYYLAPR